MAAIFRSVTDALAKMFHHPDWRMMGGLHSDLAMMKRWCNGAWEYRKATPDEIKQNELDTAESSW